MKEAQAAADGVLRRHRPRSAVVEEIVASHPSSVDSGSEVCNLDASVENGAGVDDARIRTDGMEQPRASDRIQASGRPGASAAVLLAY